MLDAEIHESLGCPATPQDQGGDNDDVAKENPLVNWQNSSKSACVEFLVSWSWQWHANHT